MRTTVTPDPDVESMLRKEVRRRGEPFKQVLNDAIRTGLRAMKRHDKVFEPVAFDMGRPRVDPTKAAALAAALEDDEILGRYGRRPRSCPTSTHFSMLLTAQRMSMPPL